MENLVNTTELVRYEKHYSQSKLLDKLGKFAQKAGLKIVYSVLLLFYVLTGDKVSIKDRSIILSALGYFIFPVDLLPDFIPLTGYADDLAVLLFAIAKIKRNITPEIRSQARKKLQEYFKITDEEISLYD